MAFVVGVDSWVTVEEADTYLTYRLGTEEWFSIPKQTEPGVPSRESILGAAFRELLNCTSLTLTESSTNDNIKNAQIEMALYLTGYFDEMQDRRAAIATGLNIFWLGRRYEKLEKYTTGIPDYILNMLSDYSNLGGVFVDMVSPYDI